MRRQSDKSDETNGRCAVRYLALSVPTVAMLVLLFVLPAAAQPEPESKNEKAETLLQAEEWKDDAESAAKWKKRWFFYTPEKDAAREKTWRLETSEGNGGPVLVCAGKPYGYLRTVQIYEDYELTFEWRYPTDVNGNSGILVHTNEADKIWPKSIQVQLHAPEAGSIFPVGGAESANMLKVKELSRKVNQWNTATITCKDGAISVSVNGMKAGEITGCEPAKGFIALQSEGSEIHFRKLTIRKLLPEKDEPEAGE